MTEPKRCLTNVEKNITSKNNSWAGLGSIDWIRWEDEGLGSGLDVDGEGLDGIIVFDGPGAGFDFVIDFSSLGVPGLEFLLRSCKKVWCKYNNVGSQFSHIVPLITFSTSRVYFYLSRIPVSSPQYPSLIITLGWETSNLKKT